MKQQKQQKSPYANFSFDKIIAPHKQKCDVKGDKFTGKGDLRCKKK